MAQDGNVFGGSTTMEPPWNHHETTREPWNHHETTTKPPGNLNTNVLVQKQSNLGNVMEYGKRCQFGNGPIWEILWSTGNAVISETVQSGKFYGIRETLSVQKRSNSGNLWDPRVCCLVHSVVA